MSLEAVLSSSPCLEFEGKPEKGYLQQWYDDLHGPNGWRSWWIVPTSRRRRQILLRFASTARLPRVLTLDGLMQHLQGFARDPRRPIGNTGQLLRVARAWKQLHPEASPTTGRILQLQRVVMEWSECGDTPPGHHPHSAFVRAFNEIAENDGCLDRSAILKVLVEEIKDSNSSLARLLQEKRILFDGFHRFSEPELQLIQAIGKHADVRLWLVTAEGQPYHPNVARIVEQLNVDVMRDQRKASPLSEVGRSLFSNGQVEHANVDMIAAASMAAECHAVAVRIKKLMRDGGNGARLSDIAVVVPDDGYLPLLKNTFRAARIDYSLAAEVFVLADSRPARVLLLALRLIRHGWQAEALFDFLRQPMLFRRLRKSHLLEWLRQRSNQTVARNDWMSWKKKWTELIANHKKSALADEEERDDSPEERTERAKHRACELSELLDSIGEVLIPVEQLEKELAKKSANDPAEVVTAIGRLFESIHASTWLSPSGRSEWELIPAREWEIDQLAFNNLKDVLLELNETPVEDFPREKDGRIDVELVLKLALAAESFQTSAEDDAGVQILKARTIRGSKFRAVFAVGLVEGKVPSDVAENPATTDKDSLIAHLRAEQKHEQEYLFAQLFESAQDELILTWPKMENDAPLMESPFLRHVRAKIGKKDVMNAPTTIIDLRQAMLSSNRPALKDDSDAQRMIAARATWQQRQKPEQLQIKEWALPLLALRYPKEKAFSATALEKYASCPFHHFAAKTLGLDELERDDAAMRWGSFLHCALEEFFKEWKKLPAATSFESDKAEQLLGSILSNRWPDVAHTLDGTHLHDFDKALTRAFVNVAAHLHENGFKQVAAEWEFTVEIPGEAGTSIKLYGKIDRIDRKTSDDGEFELIIDFKTGKVATGGKLLERIGNGRMLQLPLYGLARQIDQKKPVKHGIYLLLNRRVKDATPDKLGKFTVHVGGMLVKEKVPFNPEAAGHCAVKLASEMLAGRIALSRYDVDHKDPACQSYCSARHACRHPKGYKT